MNWPRAAEFGEFRTSRSVGAPSSPKPPCATKPGASAAAVAAAEAVAEGAPVPHPPHRPRCGERPVPLVSGDKGGWSGGNATASTRAMVAATDLRGESKAARSGVGVGGGLELRGHELRGLEAVPRVNRSTRCSAHSIHCSRELQIGKGSLKSWLKVFAACDARLSGVLSMQSEDVRAAKGGGMGGEEGACSRSCCSASCTTPDMRRN